MKPEELLKEFKKLSVLVIGDVMLDKYLIGNVDRISPEAPVPVVSVTATDIRLGGAANVALNVKELGTEVSLLSVCGKDEAGKELLALLEKHRIDSSGILISEERKTTVKSRVVSGSHQLLRFDEEGTEDISKQEKEKLLKFLQERIRSHKPDIVIYEDYNKGVLSKEFIGGSIKILFKKNIPFVVDPKKDNFFEYKNAALFKPNLREVREAMDITERDMKTLDRIAVTLRRKMNIGILMITLSEMGIYYHDGKKGSVVPAQVRNVSDVSGAGDTVIATVALALAVQLPLKESIELANIAGGLVCEEAGVVPVRKDKLLEEFMSQR